MTQLPKNHLFLLLAIIGCTALAVTTWQTVDASTAVRTAQAATRTPAPASTATGVATTAPAASASITETSPVTATSPVTSPVVESSAAASEARPSAIEVKFGGDASALTLAELEDYSGLPSGFTAEGYPFIGDPHAPVTMSEFSDYLCPFCQRHFLQTTPSLIDEYVLTGKLRMVFRDFPIPSLHPAAPAGHAAARCVGESGAAAYWAFHDQLFARQDEWNGSADPSAFFMQVVDELGLDADAVSACVDAGSAADFVEAEMAVGLAQGFSGTPTFVFTAAGMDQAYTLVGAYPLDEFRAWIDALAAGEEPANTAAAQDDGAQATQLPFWATQEGLAADADSPGYNLAGDAFKGSADAPLTIVAFSDFQCPACATHNNEVQPAIDEEFVKTGKVRWVFKHRPLSMHPFAPVSAAAAECAADQGAFWEMHDAIFASVDAWAPDDESWTVDDAEAALQALAKELDLDNDSFVECLNGRDALERVLYDIYDSEGVVSSTPTFVVLYAGQGTLLNGSRSVEDFTEILNRFVELAEEAAAQE